MNDKKKQQFYNSKQWKLCRMDAILKYPMCYRCKEAPSVHVDHTVPFIDRDDEHAANEDNHVGLCLECHSKVTTRNEWEYRTLYSHGSTYEDIRAIKYKFRRIGLDGYPVDP